ncbi:MAG: hypothetical protein GY714_32760 [Desulfobacterales bacterium]|nr:hypothetical protein [Desulfobacterales bacterium]MCP4158695.1 hypothetical protein [Deltaproteobacteria bacterium]
MALNSESTGNNLIDHICRTIAINEPFSIEEIVITYNKFSSIDKVIELIELSKVQMCSLLDVREQKPEQSLTMKGNIKLGFNVGPEIKK